MSMFELYFLFVLLPAINGLTDAFAIICVFSTVGVIVTTGIGIGENSDEFRGLGKALLKFIVVPSFVLAALCSIVPNEKQVAVLIGGYTVTNIEGIEKLPESMVKAADRYLQQLNIDEKE